MRLRIVRGFLADRLFEDASGLRTSSASSSGGERRFARRNSSLIRFMIAWRRHAWSAPPAADGIHLYVLTS